MYYLLYKQSNTPKDGPKDGYSEYFTKETVDSRPVRIHSTEAKKLIKKAVREVYHEDFPAKALYTTIYYFA